MLYKTEKEISALEWETLYDKDQVNIDNELTQKFESDYPNHKITSKLGYLTDNEDGSKTYDLSIAYELR